jgi:O-antigen/teichoic acid export membrane protein
VTPLRRSFAANLSGVAWSALMQLAFTPLYIRILGFEAYGVIGFFITLQAVLQVLDFGIAPTVGREMARFAGRREEPQRAVDFARTLEIGYWGIAIAIGIAAVLLAPFAAHRWLHATSLSPVLLERSLRFAALACAIQWPIAFYQSGLLGLHRHAAMNSVKIVAVTLSTAGAVLVLRFVWTALPAYFLVQAVVAALHVTVDRVLFTREFSQHSLRPRFSLQAVRSSWPFVAGMTGITVCAVLIAQADKLVASRLLPLRDFGYYATAWIVAAGVGVVIVPAFNTLFPWFSSLLALGDEQRLRGVYHGGAQALSVLLLPLSTFVALFAQPLLFIWTGNEEAAAHAAPIATVLVIGTALNGLMNPPYALQLAFGLTRLPLLLTVVQLVTIIPLVIVLALRYGAIGAAAAWPIVNGLYAALCIPLTHRRLLRGAALPWFRNDVLVPLVAAAIPLFAARFLVVLPPSRERSAAVLLPIFLVAFGAALLASRAARALIRDTFATLKARWIA